MNTTKKLNMVAFVALIVMVLSAIATVVFVIILDSKKEDTLTLIKTTAITGEKDKETTSDLIVSTD